MKMHIIKKRRVHKKGDFRAVAKREFARDFRLHGVALSLCAKWFRERKCDFKFRSTCKGLCESLSIKKKGKQWTFFAHFIFKAVLGVLTFSFVSFIFSPTEERRFTLFISGFRFTLYLKSK